MPERKRVTFRVSFVPPARATNKEMSRYVLDAVVSACGGYNPEEPMFDLERSTVKVQNVTIGHRKGKRAAEIQAYNTRTKDEE
jgi:hypothetical protein